MRILIRHECGNIVKTRGAHDVLEVKIFCN